MRKRILRTVLMALFSAVLIISALQADRRIAQQLDTRIVSTEDDLHLWERGRIVYKGNEYQYKSNIKTYLLMGIDSMDEVSHRDGATNGGQSDAIFLLIVDDEKKNWSLMSINRNTMTDVDIYDENGNCMGQTQAQICVQHGFGDGMEQSCERAEKKVSQLLFNLPIDGYFSVNMGALPEINDAMSGVTVDAMDTIDMPDIDVHIDAGENITLMGMQAWGYLVWRDESQVDSATRRLERQRQYIQAAYDKICSEEVDKLDLLTNVLIVIKNYTVIDMNVPQVGYHIISYNKNLDQIYNLPGNETVGDRFVEYYMDDDAAKDLLVSLYYDELEE